VQLHQRRPSPGESVAVFRDSGRRARKRIGDRDDRAFLQSEIIAKVLELGAPQRVQQILFRAAGIAEHAGDAVGKELPEEGEAARIVVPHRCSSAYQPYRLSPFSITSTTMRPVM
jgi:hypothetical protein